MSHDEVTVYKYNLGFSMANINDYTFIMHDNKEAPVDIDDLRATIALLDSRFPIHNTEWAKELIVAALPYTLINDGNILAGEFKGSVLTIGPGKDDLQKLQDLVAHELIHAWAAWVGAPAKRDITARVKEFVNITGIDLEGHPMDAPEWEQRWQELLAEYISAAVWGAPLDERMKPLLSEQYSCLAIWAKHLTPRKYVAKLRVGRPEVYVNENEVVLDSSPTITNNRMNVPIRFLVELFGGSVAWDAEHREASIEVDVWTR